VLSGEVTPEGVVLVHLPVAGQDWPAAIDTGFNGQLELPESLFHSLRPLFTGPVEYELAAGQTAVEDVFSVDFPFDGEVLAADATFVDGDTILIGTGLLRDYRLEIDFPAGTVRLERVR
jgi:predicted aspartyl protease